jgi:hypothetical protein
LVKIKINSGNARAQRQASARIDGSTSRSSSRRASDERVEPRRAAALIAICKVGACTTARSIISETAWRRITAANHGKSFNGGSLFADFALSTEPCETAAQIGKLRNRRGEPPASCLNGEIVRISKSRRRNCGDQTLIIHQLG